ncbi:histidine phosphatase family protein [Gordonia neofelifaecis]|uniref:Bifunctional RNase H/acid phosphatase n=1 Tax=Gordonia neofelifaecis NRRL B-59395 TaxID=644548 RepID=F1YHD8_9ACTN|nr:histidine phosphatase family protein [Gordonia neofelifaecis]EGD55776.1 bifunctional RNase H/acid phosphatase [Gordonia neofelifaecis NRRL B-59395]
MAEPTRIVLLRHGQTALSVDRRYSGRGNPELTDLGRSQAAAAGARIGCGALGPIDAVLSSPLTRTVETARAAADALGLEVEVCDGLIETDFGAWEGLTFREAAESDPQLHRSWLGDPAVAPPGGESFAAVGERIATTRADIVSRFPGRTVLAVSHVTPIKTMLRQALTVGPELLFRLHLDLASISIVEFYPDGGSVVRLVNDTAHLQ